MTGAIVVAVNMLQWSTMLLAAGQAHTTQFCGFPSLPPAFLIGLDSLKLLFLTCPVTDFDIIEHIHTVQF